MEHDANGRPVFFQVPDINGLVVFIEYNFTPIKAFINRIEKCKVFISSFLCYFIFKPKNFLFCFSFLCNIND